MVKIRQCSRQDDAILFNHTPGDMGLTGIILCAAIRLHRAETAWVSTIATPNLKAAMAAFEAAQDQLFSNLNRLPWDGQQSRLLPSDARKTCDAQRTDTGAGASAVPNQIQAKTDCSH